MLVLVLVLLWGQRASGALRNRVEGGLTLIRRGRDPVLLLRDGDGGGRRGGGGGEAKWAAVVVIFVARPAGTHVRESETAAGGISAEGGLQLQPVDSAVGDPALIEGVDNLGEGEAVLQHVAETFAGEEEVIP